ncbi:uncharacterized protein BO88DRAFT_247793 [Aspergillus vadensis CBS 113365]|uniref:Uncharacterized protein n=1 Tax=Aspergillus vadensis (strain CBS 113365 / IMI 142717 / IBT 24658) TaxID=1448311 RepID=A0A319BEZ6_ASPVC|nr:hypothetical protein BO88DRAFT_247793 [Aspergillus vadensis CBS 113365]PYH71237.1 hypothetical protein BO88DRAFT_247793 [Aspergillus vadensis CBS 113365]
MTNTGLVMLCITVSLTHDLFNSHYFSRHIHFHLSSWLAWKVAMPTPTPATRQHQYQTIQLGPLTWSTTRSQHMATFKDSNFSPTLPWGSLRHTGSSHLSVLS